MSILRLAHMQDVVADIFERRSSIAHHLRSSGIHVQERPLSVGDYLIGEAVVERKTVRDLGSAVTRGRFWPQVGRLRRASDKCYLLVEGFDLEASRLHASSIRGLLLTVGDLGINVVRSADPLDSARWLAVLARRADRSSTKRRPAFAQRPRSADIPAAMLAAVPGISTHCAEALLRRFGTVRGVVNASEVDWLGVPGIGRKKAAALAAAIQHRRTPAS